MSLVQRTKKRTPANHDRNVIELHRALLHLRVSAQGSTYAVSDEKFSAEDQIFPAFAVMQLYLYKDSQYNVSFVSEPLVRRSEFDIDADASLERLRTLANELFRLSRAVDVLPAGATLADLRRTPYFHFRAVHAYTLLRSYILRNAKALDPVVITRAVEDAVFDGWRNNRDRLEKVLNVQRMEEERRRQRALPNSNSDALRVSAIAIATKALKSVLQPFLQDAIAVARNAQLTRKMSWGDQQSLRPAESNEGSGVPQMDALNDAASGDASEQSIGEDSDLGGGVQSIDEETQQKSSDGASELGGDEQSIDSENSKDNDNPLGSANESASNGESNSQSVDDEDDDDDDDSSDEETEFF